MKSTIWLPVADKQDSASLRQFGLGMSLLLAVVFLLVLPWLTGTVAPVWAGILSALFLLFALGWPRGLYYPYRAWMVIASLLNAVNTRIIMFIAYFGLIVPIGVLLRLCGKAPYRRHPAASADSYWQQRTSSPTSENLREPF